MPWAYPSFCQNNEIENDSNLLILMGPWHINYSLFTDLYDEGSPRSIHPP